MAELLLDNVPGPGGIDGQLIVNFTECDYVVLAKNWTELVKNFVNLLERGVLQVRKKSWKNAIGYELFSPSEKYFEGNDIVQLFQKYGYF